MRSSNPVSPLAQKHQATRLTKGKSILGNSVASQYMMSAEHQMPSLLVKSETTYEVDTLVYSFILQLPLTLRGRDTEILIPVPLLSDILHGSLPSPQCGNLQGHFTIDSNVFS